MGLEPIAFCLQDASTNGCGFPRVDGSRSTCGVSGRGCTPGDAATSPCGHFADTFPGSTGPGYLHYEDPPPTLWEQVRADAALEADHLWNQVLELLGACGTLAALIVAWDWLT